MLSTSARFFVLALLACAAILTGCSRGPRPVVTDYDSYSTVSMGPISYMTSNGVPIVKKGPGYVVHEVDRLPGVTVRVEWDTNPPISLKRDADAAARRFLLQLSQNAMLRSTQYDEVENKRVVKCFAEGTSSSGEPLYGSMMMMRAGDKTARIKVKGPYALRTDIERAMTRIANGIQLGES